jgi:hypothetical protein
MRWLILWKKQPSDAARRRRQVTGPPLLKRFHRHAPVDAGPVCDSSELAIAARPFAVLKAFDPFMAIRISAVGIPMPPPTSGIGFTASSEATRPPAPAHRPFPAL